MTRETETASSGGDDRVTKEPFSILAVSLGRPVIFDSDAGIRTLFESSFGLTPTFDPPFDLYERLRALSGEVVLDVLRHDGYRIVEQRFPRRAYVVVGYTPVP